jgi:hypothetical protein
VALRAKSDQGEGPTKGSPQEVNTPFDLLGLSTPATWAICREDRIWAVQQLNRFLDEVLEAEG